MNAKLQWHGKDVWPFIETASWEGIVRVTEFLWSHLLQVLNVSNPRPYTTPSQPGEPPRKRTGFLQAHVLREYDRDQLKARVGVGKNALYGLFLELGTRHMQPRPWLLSTVKNLLPQLKILAKP